MAAGRRTASGRGMTPTCTTGAASGRGAARGKEAARGMGAAHGRGAAHGWGAAHGRLAGTCRWYKIS